MNKRTLQQFEIKVKKIWVGVLLLILSFSASAELSFAPIFNDGAVLQCDMPVNVWGTAEPGESVTVTFAGQSKTAVADAAGKWLLQLDPLKASSEPRTLAVTCHLPPATCHLSDVLVGEVWLATGQSNMVMPLKNTFGGEERLKMTLPEIRFAKVPQQTGLPPKPMNADQLKWKEFTPGPNNEIAAVAFYFAEHLQKNVGVVVGIIQSSYGGTPCEAWTPAWALDAKPELKYYADAIRKGLAMDKAEAEWRAEVEAFWAQNKAWNEWHKTRKGEKPPQPQRPSAENPFFQQNAVLLYENMITPIVPYTARGIIWYQGEGNAGKPEEYRVLFPAMIGAWRKVWNRPDMPFYFVQLAAYGHPTLDWPALRAAQTFTRDTVAHTGMALAIDCGEKKDIHPRAKQPVGERLARLALAGIYGQDVVCLGPRFQSLENTDGKVRVVFQCVENGLETSGGTAEVSGFEVAGPEGVFHPAAAHIVAKDTVEMTCEKVPAPASVRYAWHNWIEPPVTLQNSAGLPAEPFAKTEK
jgi:sialate O-acetylesterase